MPQPQRQRPGFLDPSHQKIGASWPPPLNTQRPSTRNPARSSTKCSSNWLKQPASRWTSAKAPRTRRRPRYKYDVASEFLDKLIEQSERIPDARERRTCQRQLETVLQQVKAIAYSIPYICQVCLKPWLPEDGPGTRTLRRLPERRPRSPRTTLTAGNPTLAQNHS